MPIHHIIIIFYNKKYARERPSQLARCLDGTAVGKITSWQDFNLRVNITYKFKLMGLDIIMLY